MILTCPACQTSYTVKDGAVPPQGRTVRCAACRHSWHQAGEAAAIEVPAGADLGGAQDVASEAMAVREPEPPVAAVIEEAPSAVGSADESQVVSTSDYETVKVADSGAQLDEPIEPEVVAEQGGWNDASYVDDDVAPRRKGPLIILGLLLLIAALAAAAYFLAPPEWMARAGLAQGSANSPLKLMVTSQDRQHVGDGNDLLSLSGRVINPTDQSEPVPSLRAELANGAGKIVYSWTIPPPAARLAPQASASFNAAELGVPANAKYLTLRWAS